MALCPSCPLATMGDAGRTTRTAHRARDRRVRIDLDDPEAAAKQRKKARAKRLTDRFYARLGASRNIAGCAAAVARIEESDSEENRPLLRAGDERPEHRWCWFCGARGSHKRRSKQGKGGEKVAQHFKCRRTKPRTTLTHLKGADGAASDHYFFKVDGARILLQRRHDRPGEADNTPHWACQGCSEANRLLLLAASEAKVVGSGLAGAAASGEQPVEPVERGDGQAAPVLTTQNPMGAPPHPCQPCDTRPLYMILVDDYLSLEATLALRSTCRALRGGITGMDSFSIRMVCRLFSIQTSEQRRRSPRGPSAAERQDAAAADALEEERQRKNAQGRERRRVKALEEAAQLRTQNEELINDVEQLVALMETKDYDLSYAERRLKQYERQAGVRQGGSSSGEEEEDDEEEEDWTLFKEDGVTIQERCVRNLLRQGAAIPSCVACMRAQ